MASYKRTHVAAKHVRDWKTYGEPKLVDAIDDRAANDPKQAVRLHKVAESVRLSANVMKRKRVL